MGKEDIIERILSDAEGEAKAIIAEAEKSASERIAHAEAQAEERRRETEEEISERVRRLTEGRAAAARLDSAKLLLAQKRRVIDEIYARALDALLKLSAHDAVALSERLLLLCAEEGDEIFFARNFAYAEEVGRLSVVKERRIGCSAERLPLDGGFVLRGKKCDKDLSYGALLSADREEHQAELAQRLFRATEG